MTLFFRLLEASVDEKSSALKSVIASVGEAGIKVASVFERDPAVFDVVPGSPFAYWIANGIRTLFTNHAPLQSVGRVAAFGGSTKDDKRYLRLSWEVQWNELSHERTETEVKPWVLFAKGGHYSPYYSDVHLAVYWRRNGRELKSDIEEYRGSRGWGYQWTAALNGHDHYFRPGLTWPRRTNGLSFRALPAGCIFADKGPSAFVGGDAPEQLLALVTILNSAVFGYLVAVQLARTELAQSYEVGLIQQTPVPDLTHADTQLLSQLARRAWSLKRSLDTTNEISHAFLLPEGIHERVTGIDPAAVQRELDQIQHEIDDQAFRLYGISDADRAVIEASARRGPGAEREADASDSDEDADHDNPVVGAPTGPLFSWLVGVAFGRFDARLATSARPPPPEPEPFDALPTCSPGMWPEDEERSVLPPDILVDDPGHNDDIRSRVASAAAGTGTPDPHDLRQWLAKEFFPLHIRLYSKSRRKAPIYWQLATPSASYSVWLYIHAFSADTFFRVQNDYVAPKLALEERRLESLTVELRETATAAQRKVLATQVAFVDELRAFLEEVKRVTPLWNPNLDDGVVINFAPLWRLVPQHKAWQRELKTTWDALCQGKYDWAHLAMHLWPERVIPKCAKDRSLAIAHGVEEVFWVEGNDGKWGPRKTPTQSTEKLISERSSPATKAALESLLEAPAVGRGRAGRRGKKS